jgi:alpha-tubulin suppressor-like RCC1 family protein
MKRKIIGAVIITITAIGILGIFRCSSPIAGNGSQIPNNHTAMVYNPGGTPAVNACVLFYPRDRDPRPGQDSSAVDSTRTDTNGNYMDTLESGTYNVIVTGDSGWAYEDSIMATAGSPVKPPACTLKTPGTIRGVVQLEQGGDSRTALILFLGTHTFTAPDDSSGNFTTDSMAGGRYRVRILTTLPDYQVLDTILTVIAGTQNVLPQPIILHYTGIPIPAGLFTTYDTVKGIVTVRWNRVTFQELQGYIVYRNDTSTTVPQQISGNTAITDTFYRDTVFHDLLDTNTFVYEYRVKVQDKSANIGNKFSAPCEETAASPTEVRTFIDVQTLNSINDTASINDSVKIIALFQNQTRMNSKLSWYVEKEDSLVNQKHISLYAGTDTLLNIWRTPGIKKVFVKIQDTAGTVWKDSIIVTIVIDVPVANAGNDTNASINDTIRLHGSATQRFGSIVKWEWKFGSGSWNTTSGPDTMVILPSTSLAYVCSLAVTDDDGNRSVDGIKIVVTNNVICVAASIYSNTFSLFLKIDSTLWACGWNEEGELGDGTTISKSTPVYVMSHVRSMSAGGAHSLILKTDGTLWACGWDREGALGDGDTIYKSTPVYVMSDVKSMSAGGDHSLILKTDGTLWVCGNNNCGQLGVGDTINRNTPVYVMSSVKGIAGGGNHSLILKSDNTLWSCGFNSYWELGVGDAINRSTPVYVMSDVHSIEAGQENTLILKTDNTLWTFGENCGLLDSGTNYATFHHTPVQVMSNVQSMSSGTHSLILKTDSTLWAGGSNYFGELGTYGAPMFITPPVQVMSNVRSMAAGMCYSLIMKTDGTLWACGNNQYGPLGDGTTIGRSPPVQIILP